MTSLLVKVWRLLRIGTLQWYLLWVSQDKFIVGVSGIVLDAESKILLLRHRFWKEGSWGLPGGYAKHSESLAEALQREVHEETGYKIRVERLLELKSGYRLRLEVSFLAYLLESTLQINDKEVIEARFFGPEELPAGLLRTHRALIGATLPLKKTGIS
ncbi:MAG TPA: NUDIX domain-containing protein [Ktedonobacteraceae bacterium]|nr:NUDIX domain-containing protein [Ktedonobacteraceae bacterium]